MRWHLAVALLLLPLLAACGLALAATPPALVNYQGVLRSSSDAPLSGTYDMTFRFYSADIGGDEILVDTHTAGVGAPVTVSGGLFNVQLGAGSVGDGAGFGVYTSLADVFRDYGTVYLSVQVGLETLAPRTQMIASAYALNAANLGGRAASEFIDTSSTAQTKVGTLSIYQPGLTSDGMYCHGGSRGAYFTGGDWGIDSRGGIAGGQFFELSGGSQATIAGSSTGISAFGSEAGGVFSNLASTSEARVALSTTGVQARGTTAGGNFYSYPGTGSSLVGSGDYGIKAYGSYPNGMAGYFKDTAFTGEAWLGAGNTGVIGYGSFKGGMFRNGTPAAPGVGQADLAYGAYGIAAYGAYPNGVAGYFKDSTYTGQAWIGDGNIGVIAEGSDTAGLFRHAVFGGGYEREVRLGTGSYAVQAGGVARSNDWAGYFYNYAGVNYVLLSEWNTGIFAKAGEKGGHFEGGGGVWADVASSYQGSFKIVGNGSVNFVQNHPEDHSRQIVYAAPEGDEVAVYTRGSARLTNGEARVALGETFKWVTDADVGLTAYVTPREDCRGLYVASVTPTDLVVRETGGGRSGAVFDYVVWGLRIGFERSSVIQDRLHDSKVPAQADTDVYFASHPDFERFSALSRFTAMDASLGRNTGAASGRSQGLVAAINGQPPVKDDPFVPAQVSSADAPAAVVAAQPDVAPAAPERQADARPRDASVAGGLALPTIPVGERVETGDVVSNDQELPGRGVRSRAASDRGVIGIVAGAPGVTFLDVAPLALAGMIVTCKVTATDAPIEVNDLLVASSTPGHAMRAGENPAQGTVIGKALEPLAGGTGTIRVLVMSR